MPTYEYRCQQCATEFEVRQSFADDPVTDCIDDACDGGVTKVFRGVGISFRGDGFYKNDHGSSSPGRRSGSTVDGGAKSSESSTDAGTTSGTSSNGNESGSSSTTSATTPAAAASSAGD